MLLPALSAGTLPSIQAALLRYPGCLLSRFCVCKRVTLPSPRFVCVFPALRHKHTSLCPASSCAKSKKVPSAVVSATSRPPPPLKASHHTLILAAGLLRELCKSCWLSPWHGLLATGTPGGQVTAAKRHSSATHMPCAIRSQHVFPACP